MKTPQLLLTLSPTGALQAELPGPNGARRTISIEEIEGRTAAADEMIGTIKRLLANQHLGRTSIGEGGAPTQWQLRRPSNAFPEGSCPFCALGLQHSPYYCDNIPKHRRPTSRTKSSVTTPTIFSPEDLGL